MEKWNFITLLFHGTAEERYGKLIELGRGLPPLPEGLKTEENRVTGCQSLMYMAMTFTEGKCLFQASSDALISAGLAALLILAYDGESPETILRQPPKFLDEIGIKDGLSPSRSNGLASLYAHMQRQALKVLVVSSH